MNRSRIIQSIYTLGVYRALGAKKSKLYGKYLLDSFVMASFTAVLGFLIVYVFSIYASNYIPSLSVNPLIALLMVFGLYIVMIIASLLPVYTLLRKTPVEILAKYDI
jgi:ABC-type antimicrobial peptide transport system permease subunit